MNANALVLLERIWIVIAALAVVTVWVLAPRGELIEKDAQQNLAMAYNLKHHGIMSLDTDRTPESLRPSRYREPLPVLVLTAYLGAVDAKLGGVPFQSLLTGENAKLLQYSNIVWGLILVGAMILTGRALRLPDWLTALAIVVAHLPLIPHYATLYSEIAGAALIALASYFCLIAVRTRRSLHFIGAGLAFGALILVKASFLYVAAALLLIYVIGAMFAPGRGTAIGGAALTLLATALVVAPWMLRNQLQFGSPNIADRGGLVLMTRAVKNGMTSAEYVGAFYAYAPRVLQWPVGLITGYTQKDLQAGGRLQRLRRNANPGDELAGEEGRIEDTISYYWHAKAMRAPLLKEFNAAGHPNPLGAADAELQKRAIEMIKAAPADHLKMTVPFMWRGAPFLFPFLMAMLFYAWRNRDAPLAAYVLLSLGLIGFYALFSHFIARYATPNAPIGALCAALLFHRWLEARAALRPTRC